MDIFKHSSLSPTDHIICCWSVCSAKGGWPEDSSYLSMCFTSDPSESQQGPRPAYMCSYKYYGAQGQKACLCYEVGGWGETILSPVCLQHDFVLQVCCGYCSAQACIRQALSLSPRYICTKNKGEGLQPDCCFDFIIYNFCSLCPHTHRYFLLQWQDLCG